MYLDYTRILVHAHTYYGTGTDIRRGVAFRCGNRQRARQVSSRDEDESLFNPDYGFRFCESRTPFRITFNVGIPRIRIIKRTEIPMLGIKLNPPYFRGSASIHSLYTAATAIADSLHPTYTNVGSSSVLTSTNTRSVDGITLS